MITAEHLEADAEPLGGEEQHSHVVVTLSSRGTVCNRTVERR